VLPGATLFLSGLQTQVPETAEQTHDAINMAGPEESITIHRELG